MGILCQQLIHTKCQAICGFLALALLAEAFRCLLITFANSLDQMSVLIWVQTV